MNSGCTPNATIDPCGSLQPISVLDPGHYPGPVAKGIEYKSASFHVTEGKGLRDEDEQALQKLGAEGWEIVQIVPRQGTNWVLVVFSRPRGTRAEVVT